MKQVICKRGFNANYGHTQSWLPISGDEGSWAQFTLGSSKSRHPWSLTGTFEELVITRPTGGAATTWTVLVNGVATALAVTLGAGETRATNLVATAPITAGDDVALQLDGPSVVFPGFSMGFSVVFDAADDQSGYGIPPFYGSINLASPTTVGNLGGALGNGEFQTASAVPLAVLSNTYSIVAAAGTVTRLDAKTHSGAPGTGVWTCLLRKNLVLQDGTGGTVDTTLVLTGTTTQAFRTVALPVVETDHLEVLVVRSGANAPFAVAHVGCSVAFRATTPSVYLICGGNNNAVIQDADDYVWVGSEQQTTDEVNAQAPVGPTPFVAQGLYVERSVSPQTGNAWTQTLRRSETDTAITVTVADDATSGVVLLEEPFGSGDTIDLLVTPSSLPRLSQLHWGLALAPVEPPPPEPGETFATRRLRQWVLPTSPEGRWRFLRRLEVVLQTGVGLTTGQGSDPQVMVQVSRDGGQTWGPERWLSAGALGQYERRAVLQNLGRYRDGAVRVVVSDPVAWRFLAADGVLEEGTS